MKRLSFGCGLSIRQEEKLYQKASYLDFPKDTACSSSPDYSRGLEVIFRRSRKVGEEANFRYDRTGSDPSAHRVIIGRQAYGSTKSATCGVNSQHHYPVPTGEVWKLGSTSRQPSNDANLKSFSDESQCFKCTCTYARLATRTRCGSGLLPCQSPARTPMHGFMEPGLSKVSRYAQRCFQFCSCR